VLPTGGGDRQIADCSAVNLWHSGIKATICVYLCDLWALRWANDFAMASCLCVFVFAMSCSVFLSVSLWFSWCSWCLGGELSALEVAGGGENELLRVEVVADGIQDLIAINGEDLLRETIEPIHPLVSGQRGHERAGDTGIGG